ncbi:hypothetical protein BT67DRAFT_457454 [Trichocladium antarcticum]|uniref:Zn(2)-C6 fungal-type domain-containing protein n=1 Tax=Trichocladium antarcticum TaxID=1450529 RepID=A0AAN6UGG0_9PEZI|nr:hypothetical protein BT67DRAFT_457454 [Trichocladium antarcticum]
MDMAALDPVLRNANVGNAPAPPPPSSLTPVAPDATAITTSQQLRSPWQSHAQAQQPSPAAQTHQTHRTSTSSFSPPTPGSTTTTTAIRTPSAAPGPDHHHHHPLNTAASTPTPSPATATAAYHLPSERDHDHDHDHDGGKKPRACESCRGLKVRCDPDPADPDGPCRRCVKAKRACVVTQPTRKRQKKTDSRVAELEKKIDALTASLQAKGGGAAVGQGQGLGLGQGAGGGGGTAAVVAAAAAVYGVAEWEGVEMGGRERGGGRRSAGEGDAVAVAGQKRKFDERREEEPPAVRDSMLTAAMLPQVTAPEPLPPDVVDRGVLSMALAGELFMRYTNQMCQHLPGVVFPPGSTVAELRATKPTLFLSVMAAASSEMPNLQRVLTRELMQAFGDRIIVQGNKGLELVQALQLAVVWYWPPERFEELKFYQLVHVAAVMAIEIGLGRKKQVRGGFRKHISQAWRDHPLRKHTPPDPTTIEARRAWLTCYFLANNTAMALHRPNLIRWTSFIAESIDILESSPDAAPTDKFLCQLVWTHKLAEEVGTQFSMDDPASTPNIADARTQYALKGFERELERYRTAIPPELQQPSLKMSFHVLSLFMHEIVTHSDGADDGKLYQSAEVLLGTDAPLTPAHINALSACLTAIDGIFEVFLSLDVPTIRCLPVFNFVRVAYAVVVLIKLYFAASSPKSELGKVINKDHMKVEQHLSKLLEKFRAAAMDDRSRPAAKFLVVLILIRGWFQKHKQGSNGAPNANPNAAATTEVPPPPASRQSLAERGRASTPAPPQPRQPDYSGTASTPLQLLSEIATNNSAAASTPGPGPSRQPSTSDLLPSSNLLPSSANQNPVWMGRQPLMYDTPAPPPPQQQQQQQQQQQHPEPTPNPPFAMPTPGLATSQPPPPTSTTPAWPANTFLPPLEFDYDYANLGDGFAQAMDLTLGGFGDTGLLGLEEGLPYAMQDSSAWFQMGMGTEHSARL